MPPAAAAVIVFVTSGVILVLEILAARILAPYVGVTLETYTGIIGTVLAGISFGNWYGGRLADRHDPRRLLGPTILTGGLLALLTVPLVTFFGEMLRGGGPHAIVILALVGFFAPAAVLAAVTPTVVKLQLSNLAQTGRVVGKLSAIATAGAIVGTFVTGFALIRAFPSRPIVLSVGALLVLSGAGLWLWLRPGDDRQLSTLAILALVAGALTVGAPSPCDRESAYFCARVVPDEDRASGRVLVLDTLRHSYVDLDDPAHVEFVYMQMFTDVIDTAAPAGESLRVLHIGGGGFTLPRWIEATRPGSASVVLELDGELVALARDELGLEPRAGGLDIVVGDARLSLLDEPEGVYDFVMGDAFGGLAVPWHLTTREFVAQVADRLAPGGSYVVNVIDYPPLGFARAQVATLREVFAHVAVLGEPGRLTGTEGGNLVLVGSEAPIDVEALRARLDARAVALAIASGSALDAFVGDADVLVDDHAPVDQLLNSHPTSARG
jgi:spermidine synthase